MQAGTLAAELRAAITEKNREIAELTATCSVQNNELSTLQVEVQSLKPHPKHAETEDSLLDDPAKIAAASTKKCNAQSDEPSLPQAEDQSLENEPKHQISAEDATNAAAELALQCSALQREIAVLQHANEGLQSQINVQESGVHAPHASLTSDSDLQSQMDAKTRENSDVARQTTLLRTQLAAHSDGGTVEIADVQDTSAQVSDLLSMEDTPDTASVHGEKDLVPVDSDQQSTAADMAVLHRRIAELESQLHSARLDHGELPKYAAGLSLVSDDAVIGQRSPEHRTNLKIPHTDTAEHEPVGSSTPDMQGDAIADDNLDTEISRENEPVDLLSCRVTRVANNTEHSAKGVRDSRSNDGDANHAELIQQLESSLQTARSEVQSLKAELQQVR